MEQKSNDGDDGKKPVESSSKSDSSGEEEKDADIQTTSSDKRKLEAKEQKYLTFTGEGASKVSLSLSPTKRKCIEIHTVTSGKIEHCEKQSKANDAKSGVSNAGTIQMSTKRSPTISDASAPSDDTMQGSPKRLATMPGTSAGVATKVSPKRPQSTLPGNAFTPLQIQQLSKFSSSFRSLSSSASVKMQGFPKHLPTIPGTFTADEMETASKHSPTMPATSTVGVKQESPKRSPKMPESPNTGTKQGSPKRSPTTPGASTTGVTQGSPKLLSVTPGTSTASVRQKSPTHSPTMPVTSSTGLMQGSPKHSPTMPATSTVGVKQGSPKCSPKMPESPNTGTKQGSPKRSPTTPGASTTNVTQGSPKLLSVTPGTSTASVRQESPTHSPTMPVTSSTGLMQGSPKRSPMIPGTSATGFVMQGSPKRSPTKRTYKERQQSCNVEDLVEKRLKEESGYQSDSALDLRKDFKKQMPSSTESPDDCQPGSSEIEKIAKKLPEEKHTAQSNFPRDPKPVFSEVTSSDGAEAHVSSTSNENVTSSTGREASSAQGRRIQNVAEANKTGTSPSTSPQHSGARPKESAGVNRSLDFVQVSFPAFSPSSLFYGEPKITRVSPPPAGPSGSGSDGYFKVPPPPPPFEERVTPQPVAVGNALGAFHSLIEFTFVVVTDRLLSEQVKNEKEMKAKKKREEAELFERRKQQARETSKKLREREARLKEGGDKSGTVWDPAVPGPSTSRDGTTESRVEENVEVEASGDGQDEEPKNSEPLAGSGSSAALHQSSQDENANIMKREGTSGTICKDDKAKKSEPSAVQANLEGMEDESMQSTSGVATERLGETTASPEHVSLQQLVPQIDEISLNDSFENVEIADSEQEDENVDLQST